MTNAKHTPLNYVEKLSTCGCRVVVTRMSGASFKRCALHSSAPELLEALKSTTELLADYIKDIGGCDHSVGICACADIRNLETARDAIAKAEGRVS